MLRRQHNRAHSREQLAEEMRNPLRRVTATYASDPLAENGCIDQVSRHKISPTRGKAAKRLSILSC
jgi:hypothetical protein